jgi:hypothetical protein
MEDNLMSVGLRSAVVAILAGAVLLSATVPASADAGSFLYSKKFYGALSLASSAFFFKEAYDARKEASRNYKSYKIADTPQQATLFYNESKRGDTRMALMLGLGAGTLAYGAYLLFIDEGGDDLDKAVKEKERQLSFKGVGVDVQGDVQARGVRVQLNRKF